MLLVAGDRYGDFYGLELQTFEELFQEAAETHGWIIVSSDNTRSDGPMEPNTIALQALWPEIHERLPTDFDRIYAAGFSGGAAVAKVLSKATGELAGILACGGRYFPEYLEDNDVPIFSTAGLFDFNYREMHELDDFLAKKGNLHRIVVFDARQPHIEALKLHAEPVVVDS